MKKIFLFLALAGSLAFTSCSKDNDDTDAIVGVWAMDSSFTIAETTTTSREEWKFKEDNTGQFTDTYNGVVDDTFAFTWSKLENTYTVVVDGNLESETYTIGDLLGSKTLVDADGFTVALKE